MSEKNGNKLVAAGVKLDTLYGATEFGAHTNMLDWDVKPCTEWAWLSFSDRMRCRWISQGDGTYELQTLV